MVKKKKLNQQRRKNLDANLKNLNEVILKSAHDIKRQRSEEHDHDDNLQKLHDNSEAAFQAYGEAQKRYEEAKKAVKGSNSKSARLALKAATSAMKATKAVYLAKSKKYNQASHGLASPRLKELCVARTYNLNEIQGLATPSAYIYRLFGSKYIQIPDLDNKALLIVQPNRCMCGPKRVISDPLQSMIRTLAFKQHIDQSEYDKLSIDDKKLFKEILAITHLQYNLHDQPEDPLDSLRAEYDKLKGELELGNDKLSIIKQLKSLSVDISGGSYGDNADLNVAELKAIMKELIIKDRPQKTQTAVWATDLDKSIRKVDASTQTEGGRVWAYQPKKKLKL
ncbi:unnamed protein product [Phytophthora lilii]|uniref:Unnamed protein product n=1 Tax=Phytophthora lilii TaxID=2077276 RepID=A0A9W6XBS3_9STRA|nr:unnamed protein product [Phytophthora lilii]